MAEVAPLRDFIPEPRFSLPSATAGTTASDEMRCPWAGDVATYAIGALSPGEDRAVEELDWMVSVVALLGDAAASGALDLDALLGDGRSTDRPARIG